MSSGPRVVFSIPEPDLLPENVAFDPVTGDYFVGSTRRGMILRFNDGAVSEFKSPREDGLWMVIGMKVDAERRVLWVCSSEGENLEGGPPVGGRAAGLFRFDLSTGTLLDRWILSDAGAEHFLNDLTLAPDGRAYVTHMFDEGAIWAAHPGGSFEPFVTLPEESYPNGITLSASGDALYVAGAPGLFRVAITDRSVARVAASDAALTRGIDGLYAVEGGLVGVRPDGVGVWHYALDATGTEVVATTALLTDHPAFYGPTTGVLVGEELHFIANAQFDRVGEGGTLPPLSELADPIVLAVGVGAGRADSNSKGGA